MPGFAARRALIDAPARSCACLSRGLFLRARFSFELSDATSLAYVLFAVGEYFRFSIRRLSFLAWLASAFSALECDAYTSSMGIPLDSERASTASASLVDRCVLTIVLPCLFLY